MKGYRLVLPARTPDDVPRLSPPLDATGYQGHYSLCPFQAPYDIRLIDGQTYRMVWMGASGEVIAPNPDGTIPGLHYFLTSFVAPVRTEAESAPCESQLAHNPTQTERLAKALATAIPALQELLTCLTTLEVEQTPPDKPIAEEVVSQSETVPSLQSNAAQESKPQNETPVDRMGVPPQATHEHVAADPPPSAEAAQHWDEHPMSQEERQWVIRWALNEEKVTLLFRELFRRTQGGAPPDPPIDPAYVPSADDAKDVALIEKNPVIAMAAVSLYKELLRAPLANPTGDYQQPRHISSLREFEKQRVQIAFRSTEQRAHFDYLMSRRDAVRMGVAPPPQPKSTSGFNREARRELERFFRDSRTSALMASLLQQEWAAMEKPLRKHSVLPPSLLGLSDR